MVNKKLQKRIDQVLKHTRYGDAGVNINFNMLFIHECCHEIKEDWPELDELHSLLHKLSDLLHKATKGDINKAAINRITRTYKEKLLAFSKLPEVNTNEIQKNITEGLKILDDILNLD